MIGMADFMPTTMDNPWHPFKHPRDWLAFDVSHGYCTIEMIAAFDEGSPNMLPDVEDYYHDLAIEKLLMFNPSGIHYKVYETDGYDVIKAANAAYKESIKST